MNDTIAVFITWTTYGTWMPGDFRGWRKHHAKPQLPRPLLAEWCRIQMKGEAVLLEPHDRETVEQACQKHCDYRGWYLFAVSARTNHVHVIVAADEKPQKVRDQLKANCTGSLRQQETPLHADRTWTKGGDCEILDTENEIEATVIYVNDAQDRKDREPNSQASGINRINVDANEARG
ncbi:transposase [Novipirellula sp. SH528]|uniref:transposase n=1 Tax=Novipirellula sp. SH528 TaxID=3454466 RepID=UPI003FA12B4B